MPKLKSQIENGIFGRFHRPDNSTVHRRGAENAEETQRGIWRPHFSSLSAFPLRSLRLCGELSRNLCLLALALFIPCLQGCRSATTKQELNSQPSPQSQTSPQPVSTPVQEAVVPAPAEFKEVFVGAIDDSHAIRLELERNGANLTGSYFYDRPGAFNTAMKTLELKGRIDGDGNATLTETTQNLETGKTQRTGEFNGKIDGLSANGVVSLRFAGVWKGGKDNKQAPFSLRQLRFDLGGLELDKKTRKVVNKKSRYEIETALPHLAGPQLAGPQAAGIDPAKVEAFNKAVARFVAARAGEFKKSVDEMAREEAAPSQGAKTALPPNSLDIDYEVFAANKDYISILIYFSEYTGGAHPNTVSSSFNYDLNRKAIVKLADLFTPNSNYLKVISDYALKELKKLDTVSYAEQGAGPKLENFHSWNITTAGLRITFDPYQVGAYAAGEHEVVVPYSVLKPIVKPDGLLGQFAK